MKSPFDRCGIDGLDFDQDGLRWPTDTLEAVYPQIAFYPIIQAAEFVDQVVFNIVKANKPDELQILKFNLESTQGKTIEHLNATAIGNIAFVATYCKDKALRIKAAQEFLKLSHSFLMELTGQNPPRLSNKMGIA